MNLGGHNEENSTLYLNAINRVALEKPWTLSFSYGRALQTSVLRAWKGEQCNSAAARKEFIRLIQVTSPSIDHSASLSTLIPSKMHWLHWDSINRLSFPSTSPFSLP